MSEPETVNANILIFCNGN